MNKLKVHYHSDNSTYAGSEQMITVFLTSPLMAEYCDITFSYRHTDEYWKGLERWIEEAGGTPAYIPVAECNMLITKIHKWRLLRGLVQYLTFPVVINRKRKGVIQKFKPDIVHINNGGYPGAMSCNAAAIAAHKFGAKVIYMANGITPRSKTRQVFDRCLDKKMLKAVDVFLTGSRDNSVKLFNDVFKLDIEEYMGKGYSPIFRTMPNTLHPRKNELTREEVRKGLGLSDDDVLLGCVSVFEPRKGIGVLVEAYEHLKTKFVNKKEIHLLLVGESGSSSGVVELLQWKYPTKVHVSSDTLNNHNFIKAMDVFVYHPLEQEDFGNNILMALKLGIPVVASEISGNREMVMDGTNGYLVEPGNVTGVVACVSSLVEDARLRNWMGECGNKTYEGRYSNEVVLGTYLKMYRSLLKDASLTL